MYESALRDLQQSVRQLENNIERVVRRYESNLRDIQSSFKKINGSAEKQIEEEIARLKSDIDKILRDFERQIGNELHGPVGEGQAFRRLDKLQPRRACLFP